MVIYWMLLGGMTLLVVAAFFIRRTWLRVLVMFLLLAMLLMREFSIESYARSLTWQKAHEPGWTEQYGAGVDAMTDFFVTTRIYVMGVSALIAVLFIRGLTNGKRKDKAQL